MESLDKATQTYLPKRIIKILSIDGGGIRGIIPIKVLSAIEAKIGTNQSITEYFDIMSGTSAGGILVCLLNVPDQYNKPRYTAQDAYKIYKSFGKSIFARSWWQKIKTVDGWIGDKYNDKELSKLLETYLENYTILDTVKDIIVPAYEIFQEKNYLFRKIKAKSCVDRNFYLKDIARATSAAPTYFNPAVIYDVHENFKHVMIDGGVSVNNPTLSSLAYAFKQYNVDVDYFVVSIGTGTTTGSQSSKVEYYKMNTINAGKIGWAKNIISILMDSVNEVTDFEMREILPETHYYRLQVTIDPVHSNLDDASDENIMALESYADRLVSENEEIINNIVSVLKREEEYV